MCRKIIALHCNWQHIGRFLISAVQWLNHILKRVIIACTLGQVALTENLCVVAAISEHDASYNLKVVECSSHVTTVTVTLRDMRR